MNQPPHCHRHTANASPAPDGATRYRTPEESGMKMEQPPPLTSTALLRNAIGVDAPETNSLCCAAAGIIAPLSATAEARIPHEKLREAAPPDATLTAQNRQPAQPIVGYKPPRPEQKPAQILAVDVLQIDKRAEFEKKFPVPERVQYCQQRRTHISSPGESTSDTFARELYAYRAGLARWLRRPWKRTFWNAKKPAQVSLAIKKFQEEE